MVKKKLFAVAVMASREIRKGDRIKDEFRSTPMVITALSEDEAIGKAIKYSKELMPESQGWKEHGAAAIDIPDEIIRGVQQ